MSKVEKNNKIEPVEELKEEIKELNLPDNTLQRLVDNEYEFTNDDIDINQDEQIQDVADSSEDVVKVEINYRGRGFKSYQDAVDFVHTDKFKRLGVADQEEYKNWLNN